MVHMGQTIMEYSFLQQTGKYIEWTGTYLYSDIPFEVKDTVVTYKEAQ